MTKSILGGLMLLLALSLSKAAFAQTQKEIDEKTLSEYFIKNKIKAQKTASGLYYVITKTGTGEKAKAQQNVSMNYIGKFLDGKVFDANVDQQYQYVNGRGPLNFTLGIGQVIQGWDEGVQLLNPGTRATLYIPSSLGYGSVERGPIPANSVLVFDVELLSAGN
jgi:FKBP-type peptidyl-prolyl cis-trans isomerase FkpA